MIDRWLGEATCISLGLLTSITGWFPTLTGLPMSWFVTAVIMASLWMAYPMQQPE